tara:strand:- start:261 stop:1472 length:1212 start_codon:yes stop_codon:yes gene_type:complete
MGHISVGLRCVLSYQVTQRQTRMNHTQTTILQVLPALRSGGVERGTIEISQAIKAEGWDSLVASAGGTMEKQLAYHKGEHIALPLDSKKPWVIWKNAKRLETLIRERGVSILHARSRAPAWSAYLAAKRTGIPFVTTFHGVYNIQNKWKQRYNAVMTKGDRVIAVSKYIYNHILDNYEVDAERLKVIHRGVDLEIFSPDKVAPRRVEELAKQWRLNTDKPIILMPGRLSAWKGHEFLIRALAALPHRDYFCMMVGDDVGHPAYRERMEQLAKELKLEGNLRIAGNTPYMTEAYQLASLVVVPSMEPEAFGRVPVEAQAMGKLVVATNHGGACETIVPDQTGFLVEPGNVEQLAGALDYALHLDESTKQTMSENAMWNAQQHFSSNAMREKTLDVYKELLGQGE